MLRSSHTARRARLKSRNRGLTDDTRRRDATVGFHYLQRRLDTEALQFLLQVGDIIDHYGFHHGIYDRSTHPLVFSDLRQDLRGQRHICSGIVFLNNFPDTVLMVRVDKGKRSETAYELIPLVLKTLPPTESLLHQAEYILFLSN
jgi:hypothetical protein